MNIRDLTIFRIVEREKSISKASRYLYMTPQGVSKIIKNLENEFNCELFSRSSNGRELTESGQCFSEYAKKIEAEYLDLKKELLRIQQRIHGSVDLLSAYGILRHLRPECIIEFQKNYPDIQFHFREYPDRQVERYFQNGDGNIAFSVGNFDENLYHVTELKSFPIKLLVNCAHPLSSKETVTIADLKNQPLYIESSEFNIHHLITDRCREAGFEPDIAFETSGFSLCHKMVKENKGISVTVDFIFDDMKEDGLIMIPFSDGIYEWKMCMLTRKDEYVGNAVEIFQRHVQNWLLR